MDLLLSLATQRFSRLLLSLIMHHSPFIRTARERTLLRRHLAVLFWSSAAEHRNRFPLEFRKSRLRAYVDPSNNIRRNDSCYNAPVYSFGFKVHAEIEIWAAFLHSVIIIHVSIILLVRIISRFYTLWSNWKLWSSSLRNRQNCVTSYWPLMQYFVLPSVEVQKSAHITLSGSFSFILEAFLQMSSRRYLWLRPDKIAKKFTLYTSGWPGVIELTTAHSCKRTPLFTPSLPHEMNPFSLLQEAISSLLNRPPLLLSTFSRFNLRLKTLPNNQDFFPISIGSTALWGKAHPL